MLLILIVTPHGQKAGAPDIPDAGCAPRRRGFAAVVLQSKGPWPEPTPASIPISEALDSKHGFKELKLGMSIDEARRRLRPDRIRTNQFNQLVRFWYGPGPSNKLGDFPLDYG